MSSILTGRALGQLLCAALGVDAKHVASLRIVCEPDDAAVVWIQRYIHKDEAVATVFEEYYLVKRVDPTLASTAVEHRNATQ